MLSAVAHFNLELEQIDVKKDFLHESLVEVIYMSQTERYVDESAPEKVCLLRKSLYGVGTEIRTVDFRNRRKVKKP